jgi:hypothetical protein
MGGGKSDNPVKHWDYAWYQETINELKRLGIDCIQCGAIDKGHYHPPLENALNLVGQTSPRDLMNIIYHADGVICPITAAMHISAAMDTPCVVIAGGREEPWWEGYTNDYDNFGAASKKVTVPHKFLHTIGLLDCCPKKGCWRKALRRFKPKDKHICKKVDRQPTGQMLPRCMAMITVDHVIEAVMEYYEDGMIPPIGKPSGKYKARSEEKPQEESKPKNFLNMDIVPVAGAKPGEPQTKQAVIPQPAGQAPKPAPELPNLAPESPQLTRPPTRPLERVPFQTPAEAPKYAHPVAKQMPVQSPPSGNLPAPGHKLDSDLFDNPIIGGKFTVFVLCYGDHFKIAHRCLSSIVATLPPHRLDLRVAGNECCKETIDYVNSLNPTKTYFTPSPRRKYPAMREMFHDKECPIKTPYIIWFDDDTWVQNARWAQGLAQNMINNDKNKVGLYGIKMLSSMRVARGIDDRKWFEHSNWYRNKMFQNRRGGAAPNGDKIFFVPGYFWALKTKLIYDQDIPDARLNHNGGDITIGCQVYQGGYKIRDFNRNKTQVSCPTRENGGRRGYSEGFPWRTQKHGVS